MIPFPAAVDALRTALRDGLDPEAGVPRSVVPVTHGHFLLMPAEWGRYAGVKVASVAPDNPAHGRPRIQGTYLLFDARTLTPLTTVDAQELTAVRTAAVSALAVDELARPDAARLVVFGTGPQARGHVTALRAVRPIAEVAVVGRSRAAAFASEVDGRVGGVADVAAADVVVCATSSRVPLFDGGLVRPGTVVVAVGSHEPEARELDDTLMGAATVVVEARSAALREAGDVVAAVASGALDASTVVGLAEVVRGGVVDRGRPVVFKSVGMAWEDLVIAASAWEAR